MSTPLVTTLTAAVLAAPLVLTSRADAQEISETETEIVRAAVAHMRGLDMLPATVMIDRRLLFDRMADQSQAGGTVLPEATLEAVSSGLEGVRPCAGVGVGGSCDVSSVLGMVSFSKPSISADGSTARLRVEVFATSTARTRFAQIRGYEVLLELDSSAPEGWVVTDMRLERVT